MSSDNIRRRLLKGEWYSYSPEYHFCWKVLRVYGDDSFQKAFYNKTAGQYGLARLRRFDITLSKLVCMFEDGRMVFVESPL